MGAPKQKWTSEEESALKAGVVKHGAGKWRTILKDPEFSSVLSLRSNVDLKDKWRNMSVTANGWGSREKARMALRKSRQVPKQEEAPLDLTAVDDHNDELVDVKPLAVASPLPLLTAPRKLDQYSAPPNLKKLLSIKLKALTANGKLSKVKRRYRIPQSLPQSEHRRTKSKLFLPEGRQKEPPRVDKKDIKALTKPQIDAELARMRNMTAEEAALAAAQAVAEAEEAMAEAEEAAREAEAAEADAEAAEAFAEAALKTLKKRAKSNFQF
ncbi:telomere repeat-binding factor 1-like isoform X2 [Dendrobium catenatum]|uniref:telomere repeat-binding factor 1-like isoform X2 n=1 Tax=Dendrobium catenatum TaxID=906689 RepID=UPI00109FE37D|nr:telomere repeat-binding factor 1-like isoform X2 [Dendrobium catenatum]